MKRLAILILMLMSLPAYASETSDSAESIVLFFTFLGYAITGLFSTITLNILLGRTIFAYRVLRAINISKSIRGEAAEIFYSQGLLTLLCGIAFPSYLIYQELTSGPSWWDSFTSMISSYVMIGMAIMTRDMFLAFQTDARRTGFSADLPMGPTQSGRISESQQRHLETMRSIDAMAAAATKARKRKYIP